MLVDYTEGGRKAGAQAGGSVVGLGTRIPESLYFYFSFQWETREDALHPMTMLFGVPECVTPLGPFSLKEEAVSDSFLVLWQTCG